MLSPWCYDRHVMLSLSRCDGHVMLSPWQCNERVMLCVSVQVVFHDVASLTEKLFPIVEAMQKHFSAGSGAYYSDAIFFLSVAMHRIMPAGEPHSSCPGQVSRAPHALYR